MKFIIMFLLVFVGIGLNLGNPIHVEPGEKTIGSYWNNYHQNQTYELIETYTKNTTSEYGKVRTKRAVFTVPAIIAPILKVLGAKVLPAAITFGGVVGKATSGVAVSLAVTPTLVAAGKVAVGTATVLSVPMGGLILMNSLKNQDHKSYDRYMEMTIENILKWKLDDPRVFTRRGSISSPPSRTKPCVADTLATHKTGYWPGGTSGILSYRIQETDVNVIIYWNVPYTGCNALGLAIHTDLPSSEPSEDKRYTYFEDFYDYHQDSPDHASDANKTMVPKTIAYRKSCSSSQQLCTTNKGLEVCGNMPTSSGAEVRITIEHEDNSLQRCEDKSSK